MLLEEMVKSKDPQVVGHDNVYATDNGVTLFKVETLAGQDDDDDFSNGEIIMYIIFILLALLLLIPLARVVIKIKKMCSQDTNAFSWDRFQKKSDNGQQRASYQSGTPESVKDSSQSMEKTLEDLNKNSIPNPTAHPGDHTLEDAIKKARENFAALSSIKDSCKTK